MTTATPALAGRSVLRGAALNVGDNTGIFRKLSRRDPNSDSDSLGGECDVRRLMKACVRLVPLSVALSIVTNAKAQSAMGDPAGSSVLVSAAQWLQGTLLGTLATVVAIIAVASVGFMMLTGRMNWRYGATVVLGCFILFGAASIVAGIQSTASVGN